MKLILALIYIALYATCVLGFRVKRGLSADQQKKLVDALNKDRQEVGKKAGLEMRVLTYDTALEEKASGVKCGKKDFEVATLQHNSVSKEIYNKHHKGILGTLGRRFFWPTADRIGCTTTYKCSEQITVKESEDFGKTIAVQGLCVLGHASTFVRDGAENALEKTGFPEPSKYADIIGIPKQVENSEVSMKLCLAILLISFISIEAHEIRAKRELSFVEKQNFLNELNKDRQEIAKKLGYSIEPMKYSEDIGFFIAEKLECKKAYAGSGQVEFIALQFNDVAEELYEYNRKEGFDSVVPFFYPSAEVGCTKTFTCSKKFAGKEAIVHGACVVQAPVGSPIISPDVFKGQRLPHPSKYGDLLGVPKPKEKKLEMASVGHQDVTSENSTRRMNFELIYLLFLVLFI